jgi:beta-N-acetylhexosaminidase
VVTACAKEMEAVDLPPFRALAGQPFAMTAHIVYRAWDGEQVATFSPEVISRIVRGWIGFDGLLMSDDLSMKALGGDFTSRARRSIAAGCDMILHCNGDLDEMREVLEGTSRFGAAALERWERALGLRQPPQPADTAALLEELTAVLAEREN